MELTQLSRLRSLIVRSALCGAALVTLSTLHECVHWLVGRAVGLHTVFRGFTSVGYTAGSPSPLQALLFSDVAVAFVVMVGVAASVLLVSRARTRWPEWLNYFLAWWALFGLSYLGFQMRCPGCDFRAVLNYFQWTWLVRAGVVVAGALLYLLSGFLVRLPGAEPHSAEQPPARPWFWVLRVFALLPALYIGLILVRTFKTVASGGSSPGFNVVVPPVLWVVVCALAIPWSRQRARQLIVEWMLPLILATVLLGAFTIATQIWARRTGFGAAEYGVISIWLFPPLFSAIWRNAGTGKAPQVLARGAGEG
jgi:hypothetical protein